MQVDFFSNIQCEYIVRTFGNDLKASMLDRNNILWKVVDDKWLGKRSVFTFDLTACWFEETKIENIKSWWCGKDANYNEIFYRE